MNHCSYREDNIYLENEKIGKEATATVKEAIMNNNAVGTIVGYYDDALTMISVSDYLLNNLNYTYEKILDYTQGSLKNLFCGENVSWTEVERFHKIQGAGEGKMMSGDGTPIAVRLYKRDSVDVDGTPIWILAVRLDWEYENYMLVNETIQSGPWHMDLDEEGNIVNVNWSHVFRKMLGYHDTLDFPNKLESWSDRLHPKEREWVMECLKNAIKDRTNETKYNVEYRVKVADGSYHWFRAVGETMRRRDGSARRIAGIFINIDQEKETLSQLKMSYAREHQMEVDNNLLEQMLTGMLHIVDHFAVCDLENDKYEYHNLNLNTKYPANGRYTDLIENVAGKFKLLDPKKKMRACLLPENLRKKLRTKDDLYQFEYCNNDENVFRITSFVPIEWKDGVLAKVLWISMDVTEQKESEIKSRKALKDAFEAAERANRAKTEFLSNMSHDIRTPMNAIVGLTALAGANIQNQEKVLSCLGQITNSSRHLLRLINEVLDMARIESGKIALSNEEFDLSELIDNLIEMVNPKIVQHKHTLDVKIKHMEHEAVFGDSLRIQQVFTNLMSNAIKYTPDGGKITLEIEEKPNRFSNMGCYEFIIEDNGIGMTEEFQKIMFEPFSRADDKRSTNVQGTGLGMAIAQNIVHMMDGDIKVESHPNKGTKVTLTIYLKLQNKENVKIEELANLPVLVVDDEITACESTVATLKEIGIAGEWVTSGAEAIVRTFERHERGEDYYAIIMDWQMPQMDGIETTRRIRERVGKDITIIVLTAYDYSEIEEEAREAGVDAFIMKPLFPSRLTATLKEIVTGETEKPAQNMLEKISESDYSGKRILLVEDNKLNREIAEEIIRMSKVEVEYAVNGKEAVEKIINAPKGWYDLVLMDIQMPVMNGYQATAAIRGLPNNRKNTPIVAMTANAFAEDVQMAKNTGMNGHIAKPLDFQALNHVLKKWLA